MTPTEILDEIEELDADDFEYLMTELKGIAEIRGWRMSFRR